MTWFINKSMTITNKKWLLYVDDDGVLAPSTADYLASFCKERNMGFKLATSLAALRTTLESLPRSSVRFAIIDLWMNDQISGTSDRTAGFKAFTALRSHSSNSYVVLLSGHIDGAVEERCAIPRV